MRGLGLGLGLGGAGGGGGLFVLVLVISFGTVVENEKKSNIDQWVFLKGPQVAQNVAYEVSVVEGEYHHENFAGHRYAFMSVMVNHTIVVNGGWSSYYFTNDLWQYSIELNQWRRLKKTTERSESYFEINQYNFTNQINQRDNDQMGWICGNELIVFGGEDDSGANDISDEKWMFSFANNQWKKIDDFNGNYSGNGVNKIGGRRSSVSVKIREDFVVVLSGRGWHFSDEEEVLDDIWKFDLSSFLWTCMRDAGLDSLPVFGQTNVYSNLSTPGERTLFSSVFDEQTNEVWTVGGNTNEFGDGFNNHVWSLNISSFEWKFVSGNKSSNFFPVYGITNQYDEKNVMAGRYAHQMVLLEGELLVFGGLGWDSFSEDGVLNDIWVFSMLKSQWKFRSRDSSRSRAQRSVFGETGIYSSENQIGGFQDFGMFLAKDKTEVLVFMGYGYNALQFVYSADLWRMELTPRCFGLLPTDEGVCNYQGTCIDYDCECDDGYFGDECLITKCFGVFSNSTGKTCNGLGFCLDGICLCYKSAAYTLDDCTIDEDQKLFDETLWMIILFPTLGLICIAVVFIVIVIVFCVCLSLCKRLKKFSALENIQDIDLILEEHKMDSLRSTSVEIKVNKKLFEINNADITYLRILGSGGSGTTVFLVSYRDQYYAYKKFRSSMFESSDSSFEEFEKEVSLLSSLRHPFIIGFFGASVVPPKQVGILLEYCKHGDLRRYILSFKTEGGKLPMDERLRLCREVAMGMCYLHSSGVIHRDVKLENVLVSDTKSAKVMDFGLSKFSVANSDETQTTTVGTSFFIAPEVMSGKYTNKIDVYSYAILVYLVITGKGSPYETKSAASAMYNAARNASFRPKIGKDLFSEVPFLISFLKKNWSHDPNQRDDFKSIVKFFESKTAVVKGSSNVKMKKKGSNLEQANEILKRKVEELEKKNLEYLKEIQDLRKKK